MYVPGEYAYPALNFVGYAIGYAVLVMATMGAYSIWKAWQ